MNEKRGTRVQKIREHALSKMAKELATLLCEDIKNYSAKSFRRSAEVQLAEAGISVAGSKMEGNWKVVVMPLEHMEDSKNLEIIS